MRLSDLASEPLAAVDRSFLEGVKDQFASWGVVPEMSTVLLITLAATLLVVILVLLVNFHIKRRRGEPVPVDWIVNKSEIRRIFQEVQGQRAKIELSFAHQGLRSTSTSCSLEGFSDEALALEASGFITVTEDWIGRKVECSFGLLVSKHSEMMRFHVFESEIIGVRSPDRGPTQIVLSFPDKLVLQQKRFHLRVEPPARYILGLALWPEKSDSLGRREERLKNWGKPKIVYNSAETSPVRAINVSAGGLRLGFLPEAVRDTGLTFDIGERYFILIDLFEPESDRKLRFWLAARVRNRYEDFQSKRLSVGFQITGLGRPDESGRNIEWSEVSDQGLELLGNWTIKRHLEMYRKKGLA
jgi:hypothetical protein